MPARGTRTGVYKKCGACDEEFYVGKSRAEEARFCSRKCSAEGRSKPARPCEACGADIPRGRPLRTRFCSSACRAAATRTGSEMPCEQCGTPFYVHAHRAGKARFCSAACQIAWQGRNKTVHVCETCEREYRRSPCWSTYTAQRYCSIACRNADPDFKARLLAMNTLQQSGRITRAEAAGYALLNAMGVEYEAQRIFKGKFTPDATVAGARLLIQFDGDYWHDRKGTSAEPRIRRRVALDRSQDAYAAACGWRVLRLRESDLRNDPDGCSAEVLSMLDERHVRTPA